MRHLGSVTDINGALIEPVDCITGGSPCQDLSLAGKRAGLAGERSGLFMEQVRIVKEMRHATIDNRGLARPRYMVWENVPGAFSSNGGKDFQAVLTEIIRIKEPKAPDVPLPEKGRWPHAGELHDEMGRWSVAYRLHDAQFFGVPQRRKRIALVADFEGGAAAEILFEQYSGNEPRPEIQPESDSLPRDIKQSGTQGEETAGSVREGAAETSGGDIIKDDHAEGFPLGFRAENTKCYDETATTICNGTRPGHTAGVIGFSRERCGAVTMDETMPTIQAAAGESGNNQPMVYGISAYESNAMKSPNPNSGIYEADTARTLDNNGGSPACNQGGMAVVCLNDQGGSIMSTSENETATLRAQTHGHEPVVFENHCQDSRYNELGETCSTLATNLGTGGNNQPLVVKEPMVIGNGQVHDACTPSVGVCKTLNTMDDPMKVLTPGTIAEPVCIGNGQADQTKESELVGALNCMHDQQAVMTFGLDRAAYNQGQNALFNFSIEEEKVGAQVAKGPGAVCAVDCRNGKESEINATLQADADHNTNSNNVCRIEASVRRLTPMECERLQGFPSEKKWDVREMTKDEYIAFNLAEKNIIADPVTGKVYGTRGPGGIPYNEPKELEGTEISGYKVVSIRNGATKLQCRVHRIIWIAQNGIIPDGYCIDHINNNKLDNRIENLQLLTPAENSQKAAKDGLYKTGLDNKATKLDPDLKDEIAYLYHYTDFTQRQLADVYGISKSRINQIIKEIGWTDIGEWIDSKGKKHKPADAPRYKALGNSIALPFWFWLLRRISATYTRQATLGSLFSGIGGFELCWELCNGKGTARWASEIEEFPIAVTKRHFPEEGENK